MDINSIVVIVEGSPETSYRIPNESEPCRLQDWLDNADVIHAENLVGWNEWVECLRVDFGDGNIRYAFAKPGEDAGQEE